MDKRSLIALALIALVIVGGTMLQQRMSPPPPATVDTSVAPTPAPATRDTTALSAPSTRPTMSAASSAPPPKVASSHPDTVTASGSGRLAQFVTAGAVPVAVTLPDYKDLKRRTGLLSITPEHGQLLRYRIINGADTIALDDVTFTAKKRGGAITDFVSTSPDIRVTYDMSPDHYLTHTTLTLAGASPGAMLLMDLAPDLRSGEADTTEDLRHLAYGFKPVKGDVQSIVLQKLDTTTYVVEPGPLDWVAIRNKYFVFAVIASDTTRGFSELALRGGHRRRDGFPTGIATAVMPIAGNHVAFDLYTGPQSWTALRAVGHELINVNPYAGWAWLRPAVQPFATIVMRLLLWLKAALGLSYGWVLVIFGIGIRLLMLPLNQSAMRTSMKMQRLQPELAVLQKKYAKDPEAQRLAMVKLYQAHDMSPFSPLMGCLPMLLPMPILFALYFVFQNTIEFRGVQFLWMPDISLRDPYYITPILMGASMLVLSWIGMRAAPPNPQAKVMGYMMPAMFTIMFMNLASGLNLYYAVQNLVAIPQQWMLTRERAKANDGAKAMKVSSPLKPPR
jgi:YidC/Oxa1 family membrane protein insertase